MRWIPSGWRCAAATAGWQFGAKANAAAARTAAGARWESDTYGATAIATRELTDGLALHLNLGGERRKRDGRDATLYAVALAWEPSPQVLLFGEVLGDDRSSATRTVGARWWLLSERLGLDPKGFLEVAKGSAAYSQIMDVKGDKYVQRDYHPHGKIVQHLKDVKMMVDYAHRAGQTLPLMEVVEQLLEGNVKHGEGDYDNCAVIEEVRRRTR